MSGTPFRCPWGSSLPWRTSSVLVSWFCPCPVFLQIPACLVDEVQNSRCQLALRSRIVSCREPHSLTPEVIRSLSLDQACEMHGAEDGGGMADRIFSTSFRCDDVLNRSLSHWERTVRFDDPSTLKGAFICAARASELAKLRLSRCSSPNVPARKCFPSVVKAGVAGMWL